MKTTIRNTQTGSVLAMSLVTCALVGMVLGSCLMLVSNRNRTAMRATAWNSAIPVLEAGIEEALTHLNRDGSNNPTANGWTAEEVDGKRVYWKYGEFPDGSHYYVTNFNVSTFGPIIRSAGYVRSPLSDDQHISRLVQVGTTNPPSLFNYAIAANGAVKLSGKAVVDGYDSSLGAYDPSTPSTNKNANGGIATNSKDAKAIDVGSGSLYGKAVTGPGGKVSISGGSVGDLSGPAKTIQDGWTSDDMNAQFQPNSPPTGLFSSLPAPIPVGTTNITYLDSSSYKADYFSSNDKTRPMVVRGNATLFVEKDLVVQGTGFIRIEPGASLKLYIGGTAAIGGGAVINESGLPANFSLYGLPTCKLINYTGNANFVGTINAPQAAFKISGSAEIFGAVICDTFTSSGTTKIHYDKAAGYRGIFLVSSWREL